MVFNPFSAFGGNDAPQSEAVVSPPQGALRVGEPVDVIDRLPTPEAQGVLSDLRERVEDLHVGIDHIRGKRDDAWKEKEEARAAYAALTNANAASISGRSTIVSEDHPLAVQAKARVDKAARASRELQDRYDSMGAKWQKARHLLEAIEKYVANARDLTAAPALKVKLPSIDRLAAEVERVRRDVAELEAEKHTVRSAAFTSTEVKARARAEIEALAEAGRPNVLRMIDHGPASEGVVWPNYIARSHTFGLAIMLPGDIRHAGHDLPGSHLALTAWLFKDALLAAVEAEIDAAAEDENALSTEARTSKLADLDARILDAERIECELIRNSAGSIAFREDADPRAVLGVDGPAPRED